MTLEELADRAAIADLIHRYAQSADAGDFESLVDCFTEDARLEMASGTLVGRKAIRAAMSPKALARAREANSGFVFDRSTHLIGSIRIATAGDAATAETTAVAHLLGGDRLVTKGIGYSDALRRTASGWRISQRVHRAHWQVG